MSSYFQTPPRSRHGRTDSVPSPSSLRHAPSPLRQATTVSSATNINGSASPAPPAFTLPSRPGTSTSTLSSTIHPNLSSHKRNQSEVPASPKAKDFWTAKEAGSGPTSPDNFRAALRTLPQAPGGSPTSSSLHSRTQSYDPKMFHHDLKNTSFNDSKTSTLNDGTTSPPLKSRPHSLAISRSDSIRAPVHDRPSRFSANSPIFASSPTHIEKSDLEGLQKSTTGHLRTLSKFAETGVEDEFTIKSPEQEVVGLHGRRRLKRATSPRDKKSGDGKSRFATSWQASKWMDQQRQFLQAYEYLCHIGEAKEWIEDIIHKTIPPIVELEEQLRNGVTLAEIVQALHPERPLRIFVNDKLQFRHSDNIAIFFRLLAEVELPELFRFELVDLYEKKNIPKVIYCIHALSWLLFRKGIVDFRIGNLVGQLQFEHHELEAMQKGLDKSGVSMPNFSGMGANFGEPEPEPEPIETDEERIDRELAENETAILAFQSELRGAMVRIKLGDHMDSLFKAQGAITKLQSRIRGDFARQISSYRLGMRSFATKLQASARGHLVRSRQRQSQQHWESRESQVVTLQSLARAVKARAETQRLRSDMQRNAHGVRNLQAAIRGALARWDVGDQYHNAHEAEDSVQWLQAAIRGALLRGQVEQQLEDTKEAAEIQVPGLQAAIRGMLERKKHTANAKVLQQHSRSVRNLQAAVAGLLQRKRVERLHGELRISNPTGGLDIHSAARGFQVRSFIANLKKALHIQTEEIVSLQAAVRADKVRSSIANIKDTLNGQSQQIIVLQACVRAGKVRQDTADTLLALEAHEPAVVSLQSFIRAIKIREDTADILDALKEEEPAIVSLQSLARAHVFRSRYQADFSALYSQIPAIVELQALSRAFLQRQQTYDILCALEEQEHNIIEMQSLVRGLITQRDIGLLLSAVEEEEEGIAELQTAIRGKLVRHRFAEKQKFYKENMEKVIKVQSFIRGRQQGQAYKSLTSGTNPPVGTVKNFVHLLNDSDFDFDEELEFERLRKTVVQRVRQNEMAEQYVDQLDIKIALLVKNKITLDEVVRHQKHFGGHVGNLLNNKEMASKDPFDLKALNKNSRKKLEHYQELFFVLQTQPHYLAKLFRRLKEQGMPEQEGKRIELLMMGLFGFAQKRREEYYLLKLVSRSIKEEAENSESLQDYLRGNVFWTRLLAAYLRSPRDRKYFRDLYGPLVRESIFENQALDLESDPMQIYRALINNEELSTGQRSQRNPDIPREQAIKDPETRETFIAHLQDLRDVCDHFFLLLEETLTRMPYGIRHVAQQSYEILCATFPEEDQQHILQVVGHWLWKTYLLPALTQPEMWGVIDRGLSPLHRRNLGEVGKVLGQVYAGRLFGGEHVYLQPLNTWVGEAIDRMHDILMNLIDVRDAERQFDMEEFNDLFARQKPTLYIKMSDIFSIHHMIVSELSAICPQDDPLREIIRELGSAKSNENEMMGVGSNEISLQLTPKFHEQHDPDADVKSLFMETKRLILYIIRIQSGSNLLDILVRPITEEDDEKWNILLDEETMNQSRHRRASPSAYASSTLDEEPASTLLDITSMSYAEVKSAALENILILERAGRLSRHNHYQDLLNALALDIRTKHRRRIQRTRELEGVRATLGQLESKAGFLDEQLQSYNDYIEQAMITLQNKKGKKRFLLPFTKQYNHERELARSGRTPRFGSWKYSASKLAEKGVLVSWEGYDPSQWSRINLTISSDEVGVFHIEGSSGSMMIPGASASVPLDDLLQAQFDGHQFMNLFKAGGASASGGNNGTSEGLRLNVNLFLHLVFKKFYREE